MVLDANVLVPKSQIMYSGLSEALGDEKSERIDLHHERKQRDYDHCRGFPPW